MAVTAHALPRTREDALAVGCDAFVTKPIDRVDFLEALTRCLQTGNARQAS